jgi:hypothetical protein
VEEVSGGGQRHRCGHVEERGEGADAAKRGRGGCGGAGRMGRCWHSGAEVASRCRCGGAGATERSGGAAAWGGRTGVAERMRRRRHKGV